MKIRGEGARSGVKPQATGGASPAPFELSVLAEVGKAYAARLRTLLPLARQEVKGAIAELNVILVGDEMMAKLHWDFMKIEGPTDVMTFPIDLDAKGRPISGEVYICVPYAQREAKERGVKVADEVLLYAVHGMLHLCGYDDRTAREFARMHAREDSILTAIGVGVVFGVEARSSRGDQVVQVREKNVNKQRQNNVPRPATQMRSPQAEKAEKRGSAWR